MSFRETFEQYDWDALAETVYNSTAEDVTRVLAKKAKRDLQDFLVLVSPAAAPYLAEMAQQSEALTRKNFGRTVQMFAPMYVSNECQNICTYCGFSLDNPIARRTLNDDELRKEYAAIKSFGFDHVLIVAGEAAKTVGTDYFENAIRIANEYFSHISLEVQPLSQEDYERLIAAGMHTVLVYQETYHKANYKVYHPKGKKSNFNYRLDTPDRLGKAGIYKIGIGALLGLEDWRVDSVFTAMHLEYLEKTYWKSKFSISFPRLRPAEGCQDPNVIISDKELLQLICAYRLMSEHIEISLSTRETPAFRDLVVQYGVTSISAGSKTNPGGYAVDPETLEQFAIDDQRSPAEIAQMIKTKGLEVVWKDWDVAMMV